MENESIVRKSFDDLSKLLKENESLEEQKNKNELLDYFAFGAIL